MGRVVGIDLGTTNSCVAILERGEPVVIANSEGSRTTPSIVAANQDGEKLVGQIAKRQAVTNPANTVFAVKRLIGRRFDDENVVRFREISPFEICAAASGDAWVKLRDKQCSPEEISSLILKRMKETAQDYLGEEVTEAVITVPAYFNDAQRQATKDAGRIAGLDVLRIINEPTAAALAYGLDKEGQETIAVFDLGGGTFDISILKIGDSVFEVLSTNGDTFLGGEDFDQAVLGWLAEQFEAKNPGSDLRSDAMARQRLKEAAERAKQELSSANETDVNLPFISADDAGPKHLSETLTRQKLEELTAELIGRLEAPCRAALSDAGLQPNQVDRVILVGGMTRMPAVQAKVEQIFGKPPHRGVNPDEVVAVGAAIQGGVLKGEASDVLLLDVTPLSLGVETQGGIMTKIIPRNTTVPTRKSEVFSTTEDNQNLVRVHVLQGERELAVDNQTLGRFELVGIPPAPRGVPQIEVSFDIDADGILNVSAKDLGTGRAQQIKVSASGGLSTDQIEKLVKEAAAHASDDAERRAMVELRNTGEGLVYSVDQTLGLYGEKLEATERAEVDTALARAKKALVATDIDELRNAVEDLQQLAYKMTEAMYERIDGGTAVAPEAAPAAAADDELIED
jgi:molecular chaperone DnaK